MNVQGLDQILKFFSEKDLNGITNLEKAEKHSKVIRRIKSTSLDKSYEEGTKKESSYPIGVVVENNKLIGLGIHIFNEDVYPLQSFEIYLRNCGLTGKLCLDGCDDMVFLDFYNNSIEEVTLGSMKAMRILGLQNNKIEKIDPRALPLCQGIDIGKNKLKEIDVRLNPELVELYINDNEISEINLTENKKLKYFYCHNNKITKLDTRENKLLRHLNAENNPMTEIYSLAPQRDEILPLTLKAEEGGFVGLKFNPIYNAQWKETGQWQQSYSAYPKEGYEFKGWFEKNGTLLSTDANYIDTYGASRELTARFERVRS